MKKNLVYFLLILIFLLSLFLRFYKLGQIPPSLDWDEASLGYNAYTILNTGKDEYGNTWPLSIRSFNDYKASAYVYFSLLPVKLFGLNEFSIRFISAFFGSLTVLLTFFLIRKICQRDNNFSQKEINVLSLLTSLFLATSCWHLQFSRIAFEANLALFFFIGATLFLLLSFKNKVFLPVSVLFYGICLFSYHAYKIIIPIFIIGILIVSGKKLFNRKLPAILAVFLTFLFVILLWYSSTLGGQSRFKSTVVLNSQISIFDNFKKILNGYFLHYDFNFLFIKGDPQARHHSVGVGQLYLWEFPFIIAGIIFLIKNKFKGNKLIFWWFLTTPLASAMTRDVPNAVRTLSFLPIFQFFTAFGLFYVYKLVKKTLKPVFIFSVFSIWVLSFVYYLHMYYSHGPIETSQDWLYGYKQIVEYVNKNRDFQRVIVTTAYDQSYIYFLFYQKPLQILQNDGEFYKGFTQFQFRTINWQEDVKLKNVLIIGTPKEIPENNNIREEIKFLDGTTAFRIVSL